MSDPLFDRSRSFYDRFERKGGEQGTTHYCPGCGHGNVHKYLAEALDEMSAQEQTVLISPVGCSVFAYYYFDVGNIQAAHGRAPAVATAVKRALPDSLVVVYQGDGDLAAIGTAEIIHAANRGENLTVLFVNNAIYGMTGGQMAPTTLPGMHTTTTPEGREVRSEGYPIKVCELLSSLGGPVYLERVALGDNKHNHQARRAIRKALEIQKRGLGFSLIEILSPCPTGWKQTPVESAEWVLAEMTKQFPLGVYCDRTAAPPVGEHRRRRVDVAELPRILGTAAAAERSSNAPSPESSEEDLRIKASGFGGQGALTLGLTLAEAGRLAGRQVSWLPSYGPEMRGGTAHCHVCISRRPVGSPLITRPNVVFAMNRPSIERFQTELERGGLLIYNGEMAGDTTIRPDIEAIAVPANEIAVSVGAPKSANMVMLGAFAAASGALGPAIWEQALATLFPKPAVAEANRKAIAAGAAHARAARSPA